MMGIYNAAFIGAALSNRKFHISQISHREKLVPIPHSA